MMKFTPSYVCLFITLLIGSGFVSRLYGQDTRENEITINNLVLPDDHPISPTGELGRVIKSGTGTQHLVLIAGWGFGADIFEDFIERNSDKYTMYAVTLPGFGGTPPPPLPEESTSYGKQLWTRNAMEGIADLIRKEGLEKPVIVGHFITSTQVALRMAIHHPELVGGVVIAGGSAKVVNPSLEKPPTLEERIKINDEYYGPQWFKTLSEQDWDEGNYPPVTYSKNPDLAEKLWQTSADVILPVMIQYLQEFNASDLSLEFDDIKVPTLIMIPSFNDKAIEQYGYLKHNFQDSWEGAEETNSFIKVIHVDESHLFIMLDRPRYFEEAVQSFGKNISQ